MQTEQVAKSVPCSNHTARVKSVAARGNARRVEFEVRLSPSQVKAVHYDALVGEPAFSARPGQGFRVGLNAQKTRICGRPLPDDCGPTVPGLVTAVRPFGKACLVTFAVREADGAVRNHHFRAPDGCRGFVRGQAYLLRRSRATGQICGVTLQTQRYCVPAFLPANAAVCRHAGTPVTTPAPGANNNRSNNTKVSTAEGRNNVVGSNITTNNYGAGGGLAPGNIDLRLNIVNNNKNQANGGPARKHGGHGGHGGHYFAGPHLVPIGGYGPAFILPPEKALLPYTTVEDGLLHWTTDPATEPPATAPPALPLPSDAPEDEPDVELVEVAEEGGFSRWMVVGSVLLLCASLAGAVWYFRKRGGRPRPNVTFL